MKMHGLVVFFCLLIYGSAFAQEEFFVQVSKTEVEAGQLVEIEYVIKNMKGDFEAPDFTPFAWVAGPMQSSGFRSINGKITQEYRFKYILRAPEEGLYMIPEAELAVDGEILITEPVEILVLPKGSQNGNNAIDSAEPSLQEILKRKKIKRF